MASAPIHDIEPVVGKAVRKLDFIYVGTPKAGSSWLFEALGEHPDARIFPSKSSNFFETEELGDLEDYQKLLDKLDAGGAAGEIAHDTYIFDNAAKNLRQTFPDVKVLICLREPGDFCRSMLLWLLTHTNLHGDTVEEMMTNPRIQVLLDYVGRLQNFYDAFPRDQVQVVFFEDLKQDTEKFWREVCGFIGVTPDFRPSVLEEVVNPARPPRFSLLNRLIFEVGLVARKAGFGTLVERIKRSKLLETLLYAKGPHVDPKVRDVAALAREELRPQLDKLEALIGKPLPKSWREA